MTIDIHPFVVLLPDTILFGYLISGLRREVDENCAILGYYTASSGNSSPMFRDNISATSSTVKNTNDSWPLNMVPIGCPETSVTNYHHALC